MGQKVITKMQVLNSQGPPLQPSLSYLHPIVYYIYSIYTHTMYIGHLVRNRGVANGSWALVQEFSLGPPSLSPLCVFLCGTRVFGPPQAPGPGSPWSGIMMSSMLRNTGRYLSITQYHQGDV